MPVLDFQNSTKTSEVEPDNRSTIHSHESYETPVSATCHHSGRYLTRSETNPDKSSFLKVQHDFPGLPNLDRAFADAAHAREHQHLVWNDVDILRLSFLFFGVFLLLFGLMVRQLNSKPNEDILRLISWASWYLSSISLFLAALLYAQGEFIFHKIIAKGKPPRVDDFPVECTYEIEAREEVRADLGNSSGKPPEITQRRGKLTVTVYPTENDWENYMSYRKQYRGHPVGQHVHAGTIALQNLEAIKFLDNITIDFGHRLMLRKRARNTSVTRAVNRFSPFTIDTNYEIRLSAFEDFQNEYQHFPIECQPQISADDSRTLELHFHWHAPDLSCELEECILRVPYALESARVRSLGRYDPDKERVIWRNLVFPNQQPLVLRVQFKHPLLEYQGELTGSYRLSLDGLISNMNIQPTCVWDARGKKVKSGAIVIRSETSVEGKLVIDPQRLSQQHEYVESIVTARPVPPDYRTVMAVINVLLAEAKGERFDLLHVAQRSPRLDPTGDLDRQLLYWDVVGRYYYPLHLDSFDIHIVISGHGQVPGSNTDQNQIPQTRVDLSVRCLHDPRDQSKPEFVKHFIHAQDKFNRDLKRKIEIAIEAAHK